MEHRALLEPGHYYHVFNRGIAGANVFLEERNYAHFLELYAKHITPVADTFAYCLMRNHFHLLVRPKSYPAFENVDFPAITFGVPGKTLEVSGKAVAVSGQTFEVSETSKVSTPALNVSSRVTTAAGQGFANFFNAYAKAINKSYGRTGSLFEHPFRRLEVTSETYCLRLSHYIHFNPQKHEFVADFREYPHSSYRALLSDKPTQLQRCEVLDWFGGRMAFIAVHETLSDEKAICNLIAKDW